MVQKTKQKKHNNDEAIKNHIAVAMDLKHNAKRDSADFMVDTLTDVMDQISALPTKKILNEQKKRRQYREKYKNVDFDVLDKDLDKIRTHHTNMREAFESYCKDAKAMGLPAKDTWEYMKNRLRDIMPTTTLYRWAHTYLPITAMNETYRRRGQGRKSDKVVSKWKQNEGESYQSEEPLEEETPEIYDMSPEDYDIHIIERYDRNYLVKVVRWLDQNNSSLYEDAMNLLREKEKLEGQIKALTAERDKLQTALDNRKNAVPKIVTDVNAIADEKKERGRTKKNVQ